MMQIMALDLEFNKPNDEVTAIIEIGAVITEIGSNDVIAEFQHHVKDVNDPISPFITTLTGITQEMSDAAPTLDVVWDSFTSWLARFPIASDEFPDGRFVNPLTWGGGDTEALLTRVGKPTRLFGRRDFDVKTLYQSWRMSKGETTPSGLAKSLTRLGLNFVGSKHSARDDAWNTIRIYNALIKKFE